MIDISKIDNPDLLDLVELDVSKDKGTALKALLYIFFCFDLSDDNPLKDIAYNNKRAESMLRAFGAEDYDIYEELGEEWEETIHRASLSYDMSHVKDYQRDIYTYDKKMDQTREMLNKTKPRIIKNEPDKGTVTYSTNIGIINKALASVLTIIQTKASMVSMHIEGIVPKSLRGGLSPLSKGKIKT